MHVYSGTGEGAGMTSNFTHSYTFGHLWLAAAVLNMSGCAPLVPQFARASEKGAVRAMRSGDMITLRALTEKLRGRKWTREDLEATRQVVERRCQATTLDVSRVRALPPDKIV